MTARLICLLLGLLLQSSDSLLLTLENGMELDCLFHSIKTFSIIKGTFSVVSDPSRGVAVAFSIHDSNEAIIHSSILNKGQFDVETKVGGLHKFCFSNTRNRNRATVNFHVHIKEGIDRSHATIDNLQPVDKAVIELGDVVTAMADFQSDERSRMDLQLSTTESIHRGIFMSTFLETILVVTITAAQIYATKRFLSKGA